ncbi:hypothetical protein [uncultured Pseudokineococcus sp.]|uniref:hypothetical protein n=1 Tax=uncultured Pseudokineococcus sp. TaxID=1642928 RepID=UPI00261382A8|nr:hypothetical protein [uncultured Pseudokineococcus sp.]
MSTPTTPLPRDDRRDPADAPPPGPGGARPGARAVSTVAVVLGGLLLAGTAVDGAGSVVSTALRGDDLLTATSGGVASLEADVVGARLEVVTGDVDQARLDVRDSRGRWRLERDGDVLRVASPGAEGWPGGWAAGWSRDDGGRAVLVLPEDVADGALDADLELSGGELRASGAFGDVDAELTGGALDLAGSATALALDVTGGTADLEVDGARTAVLSLTAGQVTAALTGDAPEAVDVDVSAGTLDLALPPEDYDVRSTVTGGGLDSLLRDSPTAPRRVDVAVTAGGVVLREAG